MKDSNIHPTAIISNNSRIGKNVKIGAYSIIEDDVVIGDNVIINHHVIISGNTEIGDNTKIFPFTSIGTEPQDLKYEGEKSTLIIGKNNVIREHVTINPGTKGGIMTTKIGDNCLFMVGSHVAHDCIVGNNVILANNATLAGHVEVGDFAIIGGLSAIRQFVRIGSHAMIGGMSGIESDVIPYGQAVGERASLTGLNLIGLKRRGFSRDDIHSLRSAYRLMFSPEGTLSERVADVSDRFPDIGPVKEIVEFIESNSNTVAVCQPRQTLEKNNAA